MKCSNDLSQMRWLKYRSNELFAGFCRVAFTAGSALQVISNFNICIWIVARYYKTEVSVDFFNGHGQESRCAQFFATAVRDAPDADAAVASSFYPVRHAFSNVIFFHSAARKFAHVGIGEIFYGKIDILFGKRGHGQAVSVKYQVHFQMMRDVMVEIQFEMAF